MNTADWLPYALPLHACWQTSRGSTAIRHGRLLRLRSADGRTGWGDCAPLPEFGIDDTRASAFAEECAQLDLTAQHAGLPLDTWLGGQPPRASLAVNASLGSLATVDRQQLATAVEAGFRVFKFKVGLAAPADELRQLAALAGELPAGSQLRLDANGAWLFNDARDFLAACRELPVEACEEPLRDPEPDQLARLQAAVPFAIAIDESLARLGADFFRHPPVRRLVIKPARHGLLGSMAIALRARAAGFEIVISSALESSCGLLACAHLAAAAAPEMVHGLATAAWFVCDTGMPAPIENGRLLMPGLPGIGFCRVGEDAPAFRTAP
ncbi:MAG TPA: o-succinylbenzoate synthase [Azonexus sp.]